MSDALHEIESETTTPPMATTVATTAVMATTVDLAIISPEGVLFAGNVDSCQVPLDDGLIGIWPSHAPLIAAVSPGLLSYTIKGQIVEMDQSGGILNVGVERCTILLHGARRSAERAPDREALFESMTEEIQATLGEDEIDTLQETPR